MRQPVQQLIQLYQNNLFTAAFNICQNQMDAEDAVQETFVQYYTSRKEFENEQHIRAWLLRVVINKAKNINRTFWKKNKCSLEDYMETLSFPDSQSRDLFFFQKVRFIFLALLMTTRRSHARMCCSLSNSFLLV